MGPAARKSKISIFLPQAQIVSFAVKVGQICDIYKIYAIYMRNILNNQIDYFATDFGMQSPVSIRRHSILHHTCISGMTS